MRERGTYEFRALHYSTGSLHNNYGGDFSIAGRENGRGGGGPRTKVHGRRYKRVWGRKDERIPKPAPSFAIPFFIRPPPASHPARNHGGSWLRVAGLEGPVTGQQSPSRGARRLLFKATDANEIELHGAESGDALSRTRSPLLHFVHRSNWIYGGGGMELMFTGVPVTVIPRQ